VAAAATPPRFRMPTSRRAAALRPVGYRLVDSDPPTCAVERLTFVAFLAGGACVAVPDEATGWRLQRGHIVRATDREGTFLDVGCANGLLMESVVEWADHRAVRPRHRPATGRTRP